MPNDEIPKRFADHRLCQVKRQIVSMLQEGVEKAAEAPYALKGYNRAKESWPLPLPKLSQLPFKMFWDRHRLRDTGPESSWQTLTISRQQEFT